MSVGAVIATPLTLVQTRLNLTLASPISFSKTIIVRLQI